MDISIQPFNAIEKMLPEGKPEAGTVYTFILKHDPLLPDAILSDSFDWTDEDRERMALFRHQGSKTSWCASRILARTALARMAGRAWRELPWSVNQFGKPLLADSSISFNWSHTDGCLVFSACTGMEVGCDIEFVERRPGLYSDIAKSYFLPEEADWIGDVSGEESWERFLSLFVQKEAWLKASGTGLSDLLSSAPARMATAGFKEDDSLLLDKKFPERYFISVRVVTNRMNCRIILPGEVSFITRSCIERYLTDKPRRS